ncbi:pectate lyase [Streptomyces sp. LBUM 1476]|uniref:Pectate lyase n=2 Tax=Streptomyces acidiscabies TaxID=42234 RepID=A0A0L0JJ32_9ACTN|nr:pectate lyase [Streptomyces acidiscabies]MBP5935213.1 pectate lyase [Streptomyces sp. LBUM 1476]KND25696.1 pectate lyase [Streptomyces acidiscabies]MBZ3916958.1 pectate lyase [Streptomyces acidiscabies]MDX2965509.1 pectate lyase [Streptomyces acidiscabies]MDX3024266.1 pectate lyase [Streptomyces acidiscabies]
MTSLTRAAGSGLAALSLSFGMIMTSGAASPVQAATWPSANGSQAVTATIPVSGTKDYGMKRLYGSGDLGTGGQNEDQDPILELAAGAVLKNVIIGAPAADGIHCKGACTLQNVWWEDVGEDAATFRGSSSSNVYTVSGGGARSASDKVFQFNGAGTLNVSNFAVQNFGTFVRSCGNCSTQYKRTVNLNSIEATYSGGKLVGINTNYGDSATLRGITIVGDGSRKIVPCQKYIGNNTGKEPTTNGSGPDGTYCKYATSDITYR